MLSCRQPRGSFEKLITISDCDVLFKRGWLEAVEDTFHSFPESGFVSPMPDSQSCMASHLGDHLRRSEHEGISSQKDCPGRRFRSLRPEHWQSQFVSTKTQASSVDGKKARGHCLHWLRPFRFYDAKGSLERDARASILKWLLKVTRKKCGWTFR